MRTQIAIPIAIMLAVACGVAACKALGIDPHVREMLYAAAACLIASELAIVPILMTRDGKQPAVAQAALLATVIHLFGCMVLGGGLMLVRSMRLGPELVYWLLALYWVTLIALVMGLIKAVKAAPASR